MASLFLCCCYTSFVLLSIIFTVIDGATRKRVCIVGAGVSGLAAAKLFGDYADEFEPIVFEKSSDVGGLWVYTDSTTVDEHGLPVHSSIYKSLRTNAVREMMVLPDYPDFGGEARNGSFVKHEDVLEYLRTYTEHFNLRQYIQFNMNVEKVLPLPSLRWLIVAQNLNTKTRSETLCDAVVVCNGHDIKGYTPKIPGIESFSGKVLHSHVYRVPEVFANQTVALLGASYSGIDISVDISSVASKVYLSHRHDKLLGTFPPNLEQVPGVVAAENDELILSNGTRIRADALIYCTGYAFDFPFLDESSGIVVDEGKYIRSIYKHLINIARPTMAIVNVPQPGIHFLSPHLQVNYFMEALRGKLSLPSRERMLIEARLPANVSKSDAHKMTNDVYYIYYDDMALAVGGEALPWWITPTNEEVDKMISNDPVRYRDKRLVIHEENRTIEFVWDLE